jgi:hypothetical protein
MTKKKHSKHEDNNRSILQQALDAGVVDALHEWHVPHDEPVSDARGSCHHKEQLCRGQVQPQLFLKEVRASLQCPEELEPESMNNSIKK